MKKIAILTLLGLVIFNSSFGQNSENYVKLISEAEELYENEEYLKSGHKYSEAFKVYKDDPYLMLNRYNAACSWALVNEVDSAFAQLNIFASELFSPISIQSMSVTGLISFSESVLTDNDLNSLYDDPRWEDLIRTLDENKSKTLANLDMQLVIMLDTVYMEDQIIRNRINEIGETYGWESEELKLAEKKMKEQDSLNLIKIEKILNERGWLGPDIVGYIGNLTLWLVIQHSAPEIVEKYLPMMSEAVLKGDARADHLGYLEDRNNMYQNRKQIYGSQFGNDTVTGEGYVWPLEDPDNVDKRRAEIGLGTMQEYLSELGSTWDLEAHKKRVKEFEENQNR